jgi:hypothetical protein
LNHVTLSKSSKDLVRNAEFIYDLLSNIGINTSNQEYFKKLSEECVTILSNCTTFITPATGFIRSKSKISITTFTYCLKILFDPMPKSLQSYKVYIKQQDYVTATSHNFPQTCSEINLSFWCFSAGVAMQNLMECGTRTIILASGTLSPLASFASEMGIKFQHQLENTHVISPSQIFVAVVPKGRNALLTCSSRSCSFFRL